MAKLILRKLHWKVLTLSALALFLSALPTSEVFSQEDDRERLDMMMINLNSSFLLGSKGLFDQKFFSHGYDIALMYDHFLPRSPMSVGIGLGISHMRIYSNAQVEWVDSNETNFHLFNVIPFDSTYKRSAFNLNYLEIPAELRYRSKPDERGHPWKISIGAKVGFKINARQLLVDDQAYRFTSTRFPNTARVRGTATFRVGYGKFSIYGAYQFTPLFHEGQGTELYPLSIGMCLSLF
jgi:hypothetical protein